MLNLNNMYFCTQAYCVTYGTRVRSRALYVGAVLFVEKRLTRIIIF